MGIVLKPTGVNILERAVIGAFIENPSEIQEVADILKINLTATLQKYLRRHFEIEEDLLRIRSGEEPKYNFREYYGLRLPQST